MRLLWEFIAGGYHGNFLWEVTMGVYGRRLPREVTTQVWRCITACPWLPFLVHSND